MDVKQKKVVVTGSAAGLGKAIASQFARKGYQLLLIDQNQELLEEAVAEIQAENKDTVLASYCADISNEADIKKNFEDIELRTGGIDALINNAGFASPGNTLDITASNWRRMFEVNVHGALFCSQQAIRSMRRSGGGSIVNIASI